MGHFKENNQTGKQAERAVRKRLEGKGWTVVDASSHKFFQPYGFDLIVEKDKKTKLIEVKSDPYPPRCVFLEFISNDEKQSPGWIHTTRADFIFYCFRNHDEAVIFDPANAREVVTEWDYPTGISETKYKGHVIYRSHGYIVPTDDLKIVKTLQLRIPKNCQTEQHVT